jgi:peptide/nickel transport system ATP-binding protein
MKPPVLEVDDLKLHYVTRLGARVQAVDGVSFALAPGQILGIAGESGCGKTTLGAGCLGYFPAPLHRSSGDVRIEGESIVGLPAERLRRDVLGRRVALIPQGALNALNPTRKIKDLAADVILSHDAAATKRDAHDRLRQRFERLGLDPKTVLDAYPLQFPAGVKQRVVIAISTLLDPRVVIADEPTSALDVSSQKAVVQLLFSLMDQGIVGSAVFITHELPLLRHVADTIAVMYAGQFVEVGRTEDIVFNPRQPYTKALMGSILTAEPGQRRRAPVALEGAPPNLAHAIAGCRFAERCPVARPECKHAAPELRLFEPGRQVRCDRAS